MGGFQCILLSSASGRSRVRGQDCVHLNDIARRSIDALFSARASGHRARRPAHSAARKGVIMASKTRALPGQPDLDQLKRQAKELQKAFKAGEAAAIADVNAHYRDADPSTFALHDAQLVLARAYGYGSWPKLKSFVDGVTFTRLADAVRAGDLATVRSMLAARPELVHVDAAENDEHKALHIAVLSRQPEIVRLLMQHGADARCGIWPHRDATAALTLAEERGYTVIAAIIHEEE